MQLYVLEEEWETVGVLYAIHNGVKILQKMPEIENNLSRLIFLKKVQFAL